MRFIGLILCGLFFYTSSLSQSNCLQIKGEAGESVSYVTLYFKKTGKVLVTDGAGKICLQNNQDINPKDTILISAIGYQDAIVRIEEGIIIKMVKSIVILPEVILVNGQGEEEVWGTKKNPVPFIGFGSSLGFSQILGSTARIIYPEGEFKKAEIQFVAFYDATGKDMNVPVRIRIFSIGKDSLPAGDYLTDNLIIDTKGKGWLEVDLKEKGLLFPKEGLIFGVEVFTDTKENYYREKTKIEPGKRKRTVTKYGFSLGFDKSDDLLTMIKYPGWGNKWTIFSPVKDVIGNLVCRVKVKVWR